MANLYLPLLLLVPVLWIAVVWIHGLIKTESLSIGGLAKFFRDCELGTLKITLFLWAVGITTPVIVRLGWVVLDTINVIMATVWPWIIWSLIINFFTGGINHLLVRAYSIKRWGKTSPDYKDWSEFDEEAHRSGSNTTIWFNRNNWSPITRSQTSSLASRSNARVSRSSSNSRSRAVSRSTPPLVALIPTRSMPRATTKVTRSSGGNKSGSTDGGDGLGKAAAGCLTLLVSALKAIVSFIIQALIIIALVAVAVLYAWLADWITEKVSDWFDEIYVMEVYGAEE
jgi:hypothetical protein